MPKCAKQSVQAELEAYARDELARTQGRGLIAALAKRLRVSYMTAKRAFEGELIGAPTARQILARIAETRTVGWPKEPGDVLKKYQALQVEIEPEAFDRTSELMDMMVTALLQRPKPPVDAGVEVEEAFWHYLRGYIATDRAAQLMRTIAQSDDLYASECDRRKLEKVSLEHYRNAHAALAQACGVNEQCRSRYGRYLDKLRLSMLGATFNLHEPGKRASCRELVEELRAGDYLALVDMLSRAEPKSRTIQHAGLVIASVLGQSERGQAQDKYFRLCEVFYARLCLADKRFDNLDYPAPDLTHTLAQDPDLVFWRANRRQPSSSGKLEASRIQIS